MPKKRWVRAAVNLVCMALVSCVSSAKQPSILDGGAVAAPEPVAAEIGVSVLRRGGNAIDAAIAIAFALAVTYPAAGNLGGGGFMLVHVEGSEDVAIDYREVAPAAAHRDMFLDAKGEVIPEASLRSHRASGVPGTVAGLWLAHERFGSLPWSELVAPAIRLAREGFVPHPRIRKELDAERAERHASFAKYFPPGERLVQADLAATFDRIAAEGREGFYQGETARLIASEMRRGGGLITEEDLAGYEAKIRRPVAGSYRGHRIVSMPPPSSGGVLLIQMLNMIERFEPAKLGHNTMAYLHLLAEVEKRAFADRCVWLGDADFTDVPVEMLTSKDYAKKRVEGIALNHRSDPARIQAGHVREKEQTTHFSVVDRWGNAVANTYTLNDSYGSGIVVDGAGFLLNNEMDDFSVKPGIPNMFGVTGGEANAIAPGKRMLSSMSPTFVYRPDGSLWMISGTPGGPTIITTVLQIILNCVDHGMNLSQAVAAPRVHHQWPPPAVDRDVLRGEEGVEVEGLKQLGYAIEVRRIGDVHAIQMDRSRRGVVVESDRRGIGRAMKE